MSPDFEQGLKDEIYGCFKHIGIPIETLYNMPIRDRKYFINKHNAEQEENNRNQNKNGGMSSNGDLNTYARLEQSNRQRRE